MKKIYFLASALLAVTTLKAQITVDFEDLTLTTESFYNGSDRAGEFISGGVTFGNDFDTLYSSWSGFAYSNITDNTTSGYSNQYSAFPGVGFNGSEQYAIYYTGMFGDTLFLPGTHADLTSVELTNTTYTYFSMVDGDGVAKKFGSLTNALGDIDGTDGKDYLFVRINGHDAGGNLTDSVDFYLADYRDAANQYIIEEWTTVDLSAMKGVNYLTFTFHSSDVGNWGINTPTYFALDNFIYKNTTGVTKEEKSYFAMYPNPTNHQLNISGEPGDYVIFNVNGEQVMNFKHTDFTTIEVSELGKGIHFVRNTSDSLVSTRKLIIQ